MQKITKVTEIPIMQKSDLLDARKQIIEFTEKIGFSEIEQCEIEIIISELGKNIIKHMTKCALIKVVLFADLQGKGIEIVASSDTLIGKNDTVKECVNSSEVSKPVQYTSDILRTELSAIDRLSDVLDIKVGQDNAFDITIRKWIREKFDYTLESSVLSKPKNGMSANGDGYFIKQSKHFFVFCIIDALGHGLKAQQAARMGVIVIEKHFFFEINDIVNECHKALVNTRGAALCIGKIHFKKNALEYTSIGNVESRIYGKEQIQLAFYDGTMGIKNDYYKVDWYPFGRGDCLVTYSDGISNSFVLNREILTKSAKHIAHSLFTLYSKSYDDATVLVVKS